MDTEKGLDWYSISRRQYASRHSQVQFSHTSPVPVTLSNDGKTILCGSTTGVAHLFDAATGRGIETLRHSGN